MKKRYKELKERAKKLMLNGEVNLYIELLAEMEQMELILVRAK